MNLRITIMKKALLACALVSTLTACSTTDNSLERILEQTSVNKPLYLRGDFTLWEAQSAYLLEAQTDTIFQTKVKLTNPDKVYEFKIADEHWSSGYNCGYKSEGLDKNIELGIPVQANCNSVYNYFRFTPYEAGWYQVSINFKNKRTPLVTVNQIFD